MLGIMAADLVSLSLTYSYASCHHGGDVFGTHVFLIRLDLHGVHGAEVMQQHGPFNRLCHRQLPPAELAFETFWGRHCPSPFSP